MNEWRVPGRRTITRAATNSRQVPPLPSFTFLYSFDRPSADLRGTNAPVLQASLAVVSLPVTARIHHRHRHESAMQQISYMELAPSISLVLSAMPHQTLPGSICGRQLTAAIIG